MPSKRDDSPEAVAGRYLDRIFHAPTTDAALYEIANLIRTERRRAAARMNAKVMGVCAALRGTKRGKP